MRPDLDGQTIIVYARPSTTAAWCMHANGRFGIWINTALQLLCYCTDSASEGHAQDSQSKLKRARLADDLNEKIALRPGPLELVEKNIIPVDSTLKEAALKGTRKH